MERSRLPVRSEGEARRKTGLGEGCAWLSEPEAHVEPRSSTAGGSSAFSNVRKAVVAAAAGISPAVAPFQEELTISADQPQVPQAAA